MTAVIKVYEKLVDNKRKSDFSTICLYDLFAGFDTIDKNNLCEKLRRYGCDEKSIRWFHAYLTGKKQVVIIGASLSEPVTIDTGSPKGSVLSPVLFLVLVSDIECWALHSTISSYLTIAHAQSVSPT